MKIINWIINFINKLLNKEQPVQEDSLNLEETRKILSNLKPGDVIWAKRYKTEKEKKEIPKGHKEGPFIIINNDKDRIYAIKGTGVEYDEKYNYSHFSLEKEDYNLYKETNFGLNQFELIDEYNFVKFMFHLNKEDENRLYRQLKQMYKKLISEINLENFVLPFQMGDIIIYKNKNYLVLKANEDILNVVSIENVKLKGKLDKEQLNKIDFSKTLKLNKKDDIKYRGAVSDKVLKRIENNYKNYCNYEERKKHVQRGSIVFKDNKYYYIYGEEGQKWMIFEILDIYLENYTKIKINNNEYYTNFEGTLIDKNDDYKLISLAKDNEIDEIKNLRKKYKNNKKIEKQYEETKNLRYNVGNIVETKYYKNRRFIIISVLSKTYECLDIEKIKLGIYDPVLLKKENTILSKNTSIEGIKWLEERPGFNMSKIGSTQNINEMFDIQEKYLKDIELQKRENEKVRRGSLIIVDDITYYVYAEEGSKWMIFKLYDEKIDSQEPIKINDKIYYTSYEDGLIEKSQHLKSIYNCDKELIEDIKIKRKLYKDKIKNQSKSKSNSEIRVGSTVKYSLDSNEKFTVGSIIGNVLVCTSSTDRGYSKSKKHYINKESIILVDNK